MALLAWLVIISSSWVVCVAKSISFRCTFGQRVRFMSKLLRPHLFHEMQVFSRNQWLLSLWIRVKFALSPRVKSQVGYAYVQYWAGRLVPPVLWLNLLTLSKSTVIHGNHMYMVLEVSRMVFSLSQVWLSLECWMKAISEAGVQYLESQREPHYGVAKHLPVNPPAPSILWQHLVMRFYLSSYLWIKCYIHPS